jgi:hypothetical protein
MQMTPVMTLDERKAAKTGGLNGRTGFKCIAPFAIFGGGLTVPDGLWGGSPRSGWQLSGGRECPQAEVQAGSGSVLARLTREPAPSGLAFNR